MTEVKDLTVPQLLSTLSTDENVKYSVIHNEDDTKISLYFPCNYLKSLLETIDNLSEKIDHCTLVKQIGVYSPFTLEGLEGDDTFSIIHVYCRNELYDSIHAYLKVIDTLGFPMEGI